jgi:hypothetical protein
MPTASSLSLNDSPSQSLPLGVISGDRDRETFSHQTLILTALAAINNRNHHPTFKATEVENERIQYMKDKNSHTSIIDAATTILITDTEILATMNRGPNRLFAIKEITQEDESRFKSQFESQVDANTSELFEINEVLPDSDHNGKKRDHMPDEGVFFSFPNPNKEIPMGTGSPPISSSTDATCKPIKMDKGLWTQIVQLRSGYIDEPTK